MGCRTWPPQPRLHWARTCRATELSIKGSCELVKGRWLADIWTYLPVACKRLDLTEVLTELLMDSIAQ